VTSLDESKRRFDALAKEWAARKEDIITEQDARFQIINRVLTEVLGWEHADIRTEPATDSGFIDYLLSAKGRARLVVEAKRQSAELIDVKNVKLAWYKAGGPAVQSARDGLEQARRYCAETATLMSAVTNGFQWIGYWALRTDGLPPGDGRVAVFPSLQAVSDSFSDFYDLFSKQSVLAALYQVKMHEAEGLVVTHGEQLEAIVQPETVYMITKSPLAADLETVFRRFFSTIAGDDPEMLAKCFVESKESREADDNLEKITKNLINRIDVVDVSEGHQLQDEIQHAVESQRGEFVLIIGNKGAGKSTFIDRFFRLVLEAPLRKQCLLVRVDLADSPGEADTVATWLLSRLAERLESELFGDAPPTYEQLQGVFMKEYDRWRYGERKHLYERDKDEFKDQFGQWVAELVESDQSKYVRRLMESSIRQRQLMPCLVFDNTDHFPQHFQEAVFQFAQSLHRGIFSFIICPITDRTIWQLSKAGPFQSYESRAFYLPVPSTKDVLARRVEFLKEKAGEGDRSRQYFLEKGIRVSIKDIDAFAATIEDVFINEEYIGRVVGWLSNHDIRRSLKIAERVITSPTMSVTDLVKAYIAGEPLRPKTRQIKLALLRGQYNHFMQEASDFVVNLFEVKPSAITSPLIRLSILRLLLDRMAAAGNAKDAYLKVSDISNYFEPCGVTAGTIRDHLQTLLEHRIVQPYDPTDMEVGDELSLKITHAGQMHYEFAFERQEGSYVSEMALTTPLRHVAFVDQIRERLKSKKLAWSDWQVIRGQFMSHCLSEDSTYLAIPSAKSYDGQRAMRQELKIVWVDEELMRTNLEFDLS
jgi:hypothetical protein